MKKTIQLLAIILATLITSCDNVYINGDLDGMWKLQKVEEEGIDDAIYPEDIYYSYQRNLTFISIMNENDDPIRYLGNMYYNKEENTVTINGFTLFPHENHIADIDDLKKFMLYDLETVFTIEELDNRILIMRNDKRRYTFMKW